MRLAALLLLVFEGLHTAVAPPESLQDLIARMSPEQKVLWDKASKAFGTQQYADARITYKELLEQLPGEVILSKYTSEAALNSGDSAFALTMLKPIAASDPNDWQATSLLARAGAESGDAACRDSNMAHMLDLHRQGIAPPGLRQYVLERVKVGENTLVILPSLEPVGVYKIHDLGRLMDRTGNIFLRITIESSDGDQPGFAKDHPKETAQGLREFTLDAYQETGLNGNGNERKLISLFSFISASLLISK